MESHLKTGRIGEEIACRYLLEQGFHLLERNWCSGHREIDIIAREANQLVIVEVRTRSDSDWTKAVESVDLQKQYNLIHAANSYVRLKQIGYWQLRFDIIGIDITPERKYRLRHIRNAFVPCEQNKHCRR